MSLGEAVDRPSEGFSALTGSHARTLTDQWLPVRGERVSDDLLSLHCGYLEPGPTRHGPACCSGRQLMILRYRPRLGFLPVHYRRHSAAAIDNGVCDQRRSSSINRCLVCHAKPNGSSEHPNPAQTCPTRKTE